MMHEFIHMDVDGRLRKRTIVKDVGSMVAHVGRIE